jgi:hypothetical protein
MYKPHTPYNVPFRILTPTVSVSKGVREKKSYQESQTTLFCSFRTFGGSESTVNGVYSVVDTATLETWYTPELTAAVQIRILPTDGSNDTGELYEVLGTPENIEMRNQYLLCKVKKITGGA